MNIGLDEDEIIQEVLREEARRVQKYWDGFWNGMWATLGIVTLIVLVLCVFNIDRARIMDFPKERKQCVIIRSIVQNCYFLEAE